MTGDQLIAEGERLARPCVYLRAEGDDFAALWGGAGVVSCGPGPYRHWLSIDLAHIPGGRGQHSGVLSIYTNEDDCKSGVAVSRSQDLPKTSDGLRLFAHPDVSFPPLDAVFRFGSAELKRRLAAHGWEPGWGYNDNFSDRRIAQEYEGGYRRRVPLFTGDTHAVLGGWHMPWPDDDGDALIDQHLIAWTFEDAEPWVEVWQQGRGYRVIRRIT
jgi:hypothetical protein